MDKSTLITIAAIDMFSNEPYDKVSVLRICKAANVSNGIFYKYFKNKEELFKHLLDTAVYKIDSTFKKFNSESPEERLVEFIELNKKLTENEFKLIKVYREGQYKFLEYEEKLKKVYHKAVNKVFNRRVNEYEFFFIMSGIRFINISFLNKELDSSYLAKLLTKGIFLKGADITEQLSSLEVFLRIPLGKDDLKSNFIKMGEELFGTKGVYETKIKDLAEISDSGIGSFYHYFKTKNDFLKEVGIKISKTIIFCLKDNVELYKTLPPQDKAILFIHLMFEYYRSDFYKYQIIRELEFIDPHINQTFFKNMESTITELYFDDLDLLPEEKLLVTNIFLGIAHYMGLNFFFTQNFNDKITFFRNLNKLMVRGVR